ncbi:unnamed protein product, partial [Prunus brigantina]
CHDPTPLARYCPLWAPLSRPHGFVYGSSRATSRWVTHPGIALAPNSLNFGVPKNPKPVSSQKASTILSALGPPLLPSRFCFWELTSNFPVGHPSWDCFSPQLA